MFHARQPPQDGKSLDSARVAQRELSDRRRQHVGMGGGDIVKEAKVDVDGCKLGAERHDAQEANALAVRRGSISFRCRRKHERKYPVILTGPCTVRANAPNELAPS